jgi:hypothetical protein
MLLAGEFYQRDHGASAPSDGARVGPYLDRLPDDGSADLDDGSAPTVRESSAPSTAKQG